MNDIKSEIESCENSLAAYKIMINSTYGNIDLDYVTNLHNRIYILKKKLSRKKKLERILK